MQDQVWHAIAGLGGLKGDDDGWWMKDLFGSEEVEGGLA